MICALHVSAMTAVFHFLWLKLSRDGRRAISKMQNGFVVKLKMQSLRRLHIQKEEIHELIPGANWYIFKILTIH